MEVTMKVQLQSTDDLKMSKQAVAETLAKIKKEKFTELNSTLINLFSESYREMTMLIKNINDLTLSSLHSRNIFELYLISCHVYSDRKELRKWQGQSYKDSTDVRNGFIKLCENKELDTSALKKVQEFEDKNIKDSPYQSHGGFNMKDLASKHGCLDNYMFAYKLCSKLVHPSSMRVNDYDVLTENKNYLGVIVKIGVLFSKKTEEFATSVSYDKA